VLLETLLAQIFAAVPAPAVAPSTAACPADMRLVEGVHHEYVQRFCTDYRQQHCYSIFPGLIALEPRVTPIRACMDTYEWPNRAGVVPVVMLRFVEAEAACGR
jgi:hypothetical protein